MLKKIAVLLMSGAFAASVVATEHTNAKTQTATDTVKTKKHVDNHHGKKRHANKKAVKKEEISTTTTTTTTE